MKKGFTLMELLLVVIILGIATASSIIVFNSIDENTKIKDKENAYKQVQRAAIIYLELDDNSFNSFKTSSNREVYISYDLIKDSNYISTDLKEYSDSNLSDNYVVKIYVAEDTYNKDYLNSCVYSVNSDDTLTCVADSEGNYGQGTICCP